MGHLNINSIRYKFEWLKSIADSNIDLLLISETKLNDSFPNCQFLMTGFHPPYRKDRTDKGGGLMFFIREDIPCREIMVTLEENIEAIFLEINLRKRKWLLIGSYNPEKSKISSFLDCIENKLDTLCLQYENIVLIGDLNSEMREERMNRFCNTYYFKCLIKEPTCFKNIDHPSCVDLILTNKSLCFQHTTVIETGLSDFHKLTVTMMKSKFQKLQPKIINYRNYNFFSNENFKIDLMHEIKRIEYKNIDCEQFENLFMRTLNYHAPQ